MNDHRARSHDRDRSDGCRLNTRNPERAAKKRISHFGGQLIGVVVCIFLTPTGAHAETAASGELQTPAEALAGATSKTAGRYMPSYTLTQILSQNHAAVFATKTGSSVSDATSQRDTKYASFEITDVLKGERSLEGLRIDARVNLGASKGNQFLLLGTRSKSSKEIRWRVVRSVTKEYQTHALAVINLDQAGAERLAFFQTLLEHADQAVSANAHREFVVASDDAFEKACGQLDRSKIRLWLSDPDILADRRRLYLAMLARCGNAADADWLCESLTAAETPKSLDILVGCYLALKGEAGLPLVDSQYLANPKATYAEVYSAIQALRFVRDLPNTPLSRESIILSFRLLLENCGRADLVIRDLMQLKDWESTDRLTELFKEPDAQWCRVPIVNFLRACPTAVAKERLKELGRLDPESVRRATTFFPVPDLSNKRVTARRHYGGVRTGC